MHMASNGIYIGEVIADIYNNQNGLENQMLGGTTIDGFCIDKSNDLIYYVEMGTLNIKSLQAVICEEIKM